jgi:hypothetical protein
MCMVKKKRIRSEIRKKTARRFALLAAETGKVKEVIAVVSSGHMNK